MDPWSMCIRAHPVVAAAANIPKKILRPLPVDPVFLSGTVKTIIEEDKVRQQVRERYGAIARLEERGCGCGPSCGDPSKTKNRPTGAEALGYSESDLTSVPEGSEMGLGCGNPTAIASIQPGETVLDLGSGGGFDCFLAARQTGPKGRVIGVDMTPDMISKARAHATKGDYENVEFRLGEIENLPVADGAVDLVISNCVINLSPNKDLVYAEIFRVLKPGGRIAISDIVALRPIPEDLKEDFQAYTGCIAGAASVAELENMLRNEGFRDIRVEIKQSSRDFINEWLPDKRAGDYVASANITAVKPASPCCGASCCT
jgi:arsenite methyltransferase